MLEGVFMKSGFDDRGMGKSGKTIKSPFDYTQPPYDQRSSCFVNAGTHHGVGLTQPIGHADNPKQTVSALPYGRVNTMDLYHDGKKTEVL